MRQERCVDAPGILLLYNCPESGVASTIVEHVSELVRQSSFPVWAVNTEHGVPEFLKRFQFPAIAYHYSLFGSFPFQLDEAFRQFLGTQRNAHRIAFFQDEYYNCRERFRFIREAPVDTIYTLVAPEWQASVYGKHTPGRRLVYTLPSYVGSDYRTLAERFSLSHSSRRIDVGYRGRIVHAFMGRGAYEKVKIADCFQKHADKHNLVTDITIAENKRLYGDRWFRFLGSCKVVLGVEAGTSVFDLDGTARAACEEYVRSHPQATLDEISDAVLQPWEGKIFYRTIAPRHFEAAATLTPQVLFEGAYSGILEADRHYIRLKKDFSNIKDVIKQIRDPRRRTEVANAAHDELIASDKYTYKSFAQSFDAELQTVMDVQRIGVPVQGEAAELARQIARHERSQQRRQKIRAYVDRNMSRAKRLGSRILSLVIRTPWRVTRSTWRMCRNRLLSSLALALRLRYRIRCKISQIVRNRKLR